MSALPYVVDLLLGAACVWLLLTALEALSPRRRCSTCLHRATSWCSCVSTGLEDWTPREGGR